jgi:hypothetical protein
MMYISGRMEQATCFKSTQFATACSSIYLSITSILAKFVATELCVIELVSLILLTMV